MTPSATAAPGRLELVRRFVNTRDFEKDIDALATSDDLTAWLRSVELLATHVRARRVDVQRVQDVREALRAAMAANHSGEPIGEGPLQVLNSAAVDAKLTATLTAQARSAAQPGAGGVAGAVGSLLSVVVDAMGEGTWSRLKVCVNDECRWAFYDHSRARSGRWCSMSACGNRAKQRSWRERQA